MSNLNDDAIFDFFSTLLKDKREEKQAVKSVPFCKMPTKQDINERHSLFVEEESNHVNRKKLSMLLSPVGAYGLKSKIEGDDSVSSLLKEGVSQKPTLLSKENMSSVDISDEIDVGQADVSRHSEILIQTEKNQDSQEKDRLSNEKNQNVVFLHEQLDEVFQVLFFELSGLILAVPLLELGGIININRIKSIVGSPHWYLGSQAHRGSQVNLVDTCAWVMPEKRVLLKQPIEYKYIALLGKSQWGLAFHRVVKTGQLAKSDVQWRKRSGKRPWLAGIVKQQMCIILDVQMFIRMLNQGLSCQGSN
ncbi:chemotaxis protein CheW [uncultured Shewanella sp.]|uniref:chemotaxis protein CheW n=1 Tax=uncultured Shewanella sp. TaxID=173975 RepID=UPI00262766AB|nr:chemotaxis protein CheW [uncultured Shewanella sp.]